MPFAHLLPPLKWSLTCYTRGKPSPVGGGAAWLSSFWYTSWSHRVHCPHCHGVWPLHGHLQASALYHHHETGALPAPGGGGLDWGTLHSTVQILFMVDLTFCGCNVIDHFRCDFFSLLEIVCSDTYMLGMVVATNSGATCLLIFSMLLISYMVILSSLKSHGSEGWCKALSKCGSHFTVVVLFFVPCIFSYTCPVTTYPADKLVNVVFVILTLMLSPNIYAVRNTDVKNAMKCLWKRRVTSFSRCEESDNLYT